jgi:hypothetical protein
MFDLARRLNAPVALKDIGMPPDGIERAADLTVATPYPNPRPVEREGIRALLDDAFHGRRLRASRNGASASHRAFKTALGISRADRSTPRDVRTSTISY